MRTEQSMFGERLRQALKDAGYPQSPTDIAKLLPKFEGDPSTPQAVSRWLHGKSVPRQRQIKALAKMCRTEPGLLQYGVTASGAKFVREPSSQFTIAAPDQHAMDAFVMLPAKKRRLMRDLIDELSEWDKKKKR